MIFQKLVVLEGRTRKLIQFNPKRCCARERLKSFEFTEVSRTHILVEIAA